MEKNFGPFDASEFSTLDDALFGAHKGIISLSAKHNFTHKNRSHQTGIVKGGGVRTWIPKKIKCKRRKEFELADPKILKSCGWK